MSLIDRKTRIPLNTICFIPEDPRCPQPFEGIEHQDDFWPAAPAATALVAISPATADSNAGGR